MSGVRPGGTLSVAVVVPVRDGAPVLVRCLDALSRQTRPADTIFVVDNGSTDRSRAIAQGLGARVLLESTHGTPAAAARGYDEVEADVILRLDADTVAPVDWIERMLARFEDDPSLDALSGAARFAGLPAPLSWLLGRLYLFAYYDVFAGMLGMRVLFGSNLGMRTAAWRRVSDLVHRQDAVVHDDLDLAVHLGLTGHRVVVARDIQVAISAVPLTRPVGLLRRATRAAYTVALHPELRLAIPPARV